MERKGNYSFINSLAWARFVIVYPQLIDDQEPEWLKALTALRSRDNSCALRVLRHVSQIELFRSSEAVNWIKSKNWAQGKLHLFYPNVIFLMRLLLVSEIKMVLEE